MSTSTVPSETPKPKGKLWFRLVIAALTAVLGVLGYSVS